MPRPRVFVTRRIPDAGLDALRAHCDVDVWQPDVPPAQEELLARARDCDGLVTLLSDRIDAALIAACPRLRVVSNYAVGVDNVDLRACAARGIAVGNTPDVLTDATADLALALLLAVARRLPEAERAVRSGAWRTWEPRGHVGLDLVGATLGVVGLGRIGAAFARRCRGAWGMRVLYAAPRRVVAAEEELAAEHVPLERLFAESDFVSLHAPLTPATRHVVDAAALARMKPTAVLVNTARGGLVDQEALHAALASGRLFAAALDVTDPEPLPPTHPLLALPNCLVLPHVGSATVRTRDAMARIAADNLLAGLAGRALPHAVPLPAPPPGT